MGDRAVDRTRHMRWQVLSVLPTNLRYLAWRRWENSTQPPKQDRCWSRYRYYASLRYFWIQRGRVARVHCNATANKQTSIEVECHLIYISYIDFVDKLVCIGINSLCQRFSIVGEAYQEVCKGVVCGCPIDKQTKQNKNNKLYEFHNSTHWFL